MKALQIICIAGAITVTGVILHVGGETPDATVPDTVGQAAASDETPAALAAALSEIPAGPTTAPGASPGSVPRAAYVPSLMARADIGGDSFEARWASFGRPDAAQPVPAARDASNDASNPAPAKQDFRYLVYYVWNELPP